MVLDKLEQLNTEELYKLRMQIIQADTNLLEYEKRWLKIQYDRMSDNLKSVPCVDMPKEQPKWTPEVQIPKVPPKATNRIETKLVPKAEAYQPIVPPQYILDLNLKWDAIIKTAYANTRRVSAYANDNRDICVVLDHAQEPLSVWEICDQLIYLPGFQGLDHSKKYQFVAAKLATLTQKGLVTKNPFDNKNMMYQIAQKYITKGSVGVTCS
jgi:hypothetical protein